MEEWGVNPIPPTKKETLYVSEEVKSDFSDFVIIPYNDTYFKH